MPKINDGELPGIVQVYNSEGRTAAYGLLRSQYGIKNPYFVIKRIRKNPRFEYNEAEDRYLVRDEPDAAGVFMSMAELCSPVAPQHFPTSEKQLSDNRPAAMEKLIRELLGDRLLELSRYIALDPSAKTMAIDLASLKAAGYRIITQ